MNEDINTKRVASKELIRLCGKGRRSSIVSLNNLQKHSLTKHYGKLERLFRELEALYLEKQEKEMYDSISLLKDLAPNFYKIAEFIKVVDNKELELKIRRMNKRYKGNLSYNDSIYFQKAFHILKLKREHLLKEQSEILEKNIL